jgi:UDP-N-acetyl-D-galactosamine dehydrogenase
MGDYVANQVVRCMNKKGVIVKDSKILILGITFKENCPDVRNTKVCDIYTTLSEYTSNITIYDPWANNEVVKKEYGIEVVNTLPQDRYDAVVLAVAHKAFESLNLKAVLNDNSVVYDVKGVLDREIVDARL